jgi:uncharacterized membrane protein YccC
MKRMRKPLHMLLDAVDATMRGESHDESVLRGHAERISAEWRRVRQEVYYERLEVDGRMVHPVMANAMPLHVYMFNLIRLLGGVSDYAAAVRAERAVTRSDRIRRWLKAYLQDFVPSKAPFARNLPAYKQPFKVAVALALSSLWYAVPTLQDASSGRGIWAGITICFIVSPDVGNAVLKSLNRMQGTLLACMYSLTAMGLAGGRGDGVLVAFMCVWVAFVSQFRGGAEHGYAAVVAAFTVPVFFFGAIDMPKNVQLENYYDALTMARMEMTALGVALYLFVEVVLWPIVPRTIVRQEGGRWFALVASFVEACATAVDDVVTRNENDHHHHHHTNTTTTTTTTQRQRHH